MHRVWTPDSWTKVLLLASEPLRHSSLIISACLQYPELRFSMEKVMTSTGLEPRTSWPKASVLPLSHHGFLFLLIDFSYWSLMWPLRWSHMFPDILPSFAYCSNVLFLALLSYEGAFTVVAWTVTFSWCLSVFLVSNDPLTLPWHVLRDILWYVILRLY